MAQIDQYKAILDELYHQKKHQSLGKPNEWDRSKEREEAQAELIKERYKINSDGIKRYYELRQRWSDRIRSLKMSSKGWRIDQI